MVSKETYVVASIPDWSIRNFDKLKKLGGEWYLIADKDDFTFHHLKMIKPRYIFIPHWSWLIPEEIYSKYECVIFHMTDLPFGRGGTPLQNLLSRGIYETQISAIRAAKGIDTGDIYLKRALSLEGDAEGIYIRCFDIITDMIKEIIEANPAPTPQEGKAVVFKRRTPEQSRIEKCALPELYDHIRMLDADGYPRAFLEYKGFRLEFSRASLKDGYIMADVRII